MQEPDRRPEEERVPFHPSLLQRVLALLGVAALIFLFCALLYLLRLTSA